MGELLVMCLTVVATLIFLFSTFFLSKALTHNFNYDFIWEFVGYLIGFAILAIVLTTKSYLLINIVFFASVIPVFYVFAKYEVLIDRGFDVELLTKSKK